ncbi:Speckle-type POZ protein [Cricetulus griseus]|uniref:Speckle-type POZ protein n=1 Tax=Cricetulus griseus TaxID=10029 RepID=G3IGL8_CRIGR|nr:Speckle-type POZ protein [Cricetulus griseus]
MSEDRAVERSGHTNFSVQKFSYSWTISNFGFLLQEIGEGIKSPTFSSGFSDNDKWCLKILPNGIDEESKDYLSVHLTMLSCPTIPAWARFRFWIISVDGEKTNGKISPRFFKFMPKQHWGFKKFIHRDLLSFVESWLYPDNELTIFCEVDLVVQDSLINSGKSTVPGFRAMMDFIYTGKAPDLHSMADAVLAATDKYGLDRLKVMLEDALCRDHSVENAAHTLILADLHNAE